MEVVYLTIAHQHTSLLSPGPFHSILYVLPKSQWTPGSVGDMLPDPGGCLDLRVELSPVLTVHRHRPHREEALCSQWHIGMAVITLALRAFIKSVT